MIEIIDIVTIFVFAFVIMYYVVNIRTTNMLLQKIYLSVAVFLFCLILELIKSFRHASCASLSQNEVLRHASCASLRQNEVLRHTHVSMGIFQKCFYFALLTYVAHTTLHDLSTENLQNLKLYMTDEVILALFITFFIAVGKLFIGIFNLGGHKHD